MENKELFVKIIRKKSSYDYKYNNKISTFANNIRNNCKDIIELYKNNELLYKCDCIQTIANYPGCNEKDTVKIGKFQIKCFVKTSITFADPKNPDRIKIHGIINAIDNEGQLIDNSSMQWENQQYKGRWLIHSTYWPKTDCDSGNGYSMGCFIFKETKELDKFNNILLNNGINIGDIINAELQEINE